MRGCLNVVDNPDIWRDEVFVHQTNIEVHINIHIVGHREVNDTEAQVQCSSIDGSPSGLVQAGEQRTQL
jgi:hypothetical protein